jgi:hypothetical protein
MHTRTQIYHAQEEVEILMYEVYVDGGRAMAIVSI